MLMERQRVLRVSGWQRPWAQPLPVAPRSVLQAVHPLLPTVSDPGYRWLTGALQEFWAALGQGHRASAGHQPQEAEEGSGAGELAAGEGTPDAVSTSEHRGAWWGAARGATH